MKALEFLCIYILEATIRSKLTPVKRSVHTNSTVHSALPFVLMPQTHSRNGELDLKRKCKSLDTSSFLNQVILNLIFPTARLVICLPGPGPSRPCRHLAPHGLGSLYRR